MALCFVAVLGISLASYITICTRAMQLSNRSFQASVSKQLAEAGLDEALRAFNQNNWDDWTGGGISVDWTLDTTNKRATATMTFPADKFGQGTTATVKLRVDNYDANVVGVSWSNSISYSIGDLVGYNGIWYRCVKSNSGQTPSPIGNLDHWVPAPIAWTWQPNAPYYDEDMVNHNGTWYRCTADHTSPSSWTGTNWTTIGAIDSYSNSYWSHSIGDIFYYANTTTWYRWTATGASYTSTPDISWQYRAAKTYRFNDVVCYYSGGAYNWYRCIAATSTGNLPTNSTYWQNILSGSMHGWSSSQNYNLGDTIYHSATSDWYRCIRANSNQTPASTSSYWANTPQFSNEWDTTRQFSQNDTVRYNGVWYLSLQNNNVGRNPKTATSYWIGADTTNTSYTWSASTGYSVNAYRCYGGVWYKCIAATTANAGHTPNNTAYWSPAWNNSKGVTTGAPVAYAEATINLTGSPTQRTQLRATLAPVALFPNAAGASTDLIITTGTGTVDSYDHSLGTTYAAQVGASTNYSAVLAAGSSLSIQGTTAVKGYLAWPSPPSGISTGTTVWSATSPASPNVDVSRVSRSPWVPQFDIHSVPAGTALPDPTTWSSSTLSIGTPGATTPSVYYYNSDLDLNSDALIIAGPVILDIRGALTVSGTNGRIIVGSSGSAEIHFSGRLRVLSGYSNCGFDNRTLDPKKLLLIGTSSATNHAYQSTAFSVYGVFYLPNGTLSFDNSPQIHGAVSAKKVVFGSAANLHYDTSLRYATFGGVDQPWTVTDWRELPVTEQATMP